MVNGKISAVLIARDEEKNIRRALDSVAWADEIVVLDTGSSDGTVEICREAGARVEQHEWPGFVAAKNVAAELATSEWIVSIDADEEVTAELKEEVEKIIADPDARDGYRIPRRNHYRGRWIRHCGWYPDPQLRLWRRGKGKWVGGRVHERVEVNGIVGRTSAALNHYSYDSISEHLDRMNKYSGLAALDKFESGKRTGPLGLLFVVPWQFFRLYFLRLGILDGLPGLVVSALGAYYAFLKKARLWELQLHHRGDRSGDD